MKKILILFFTGVTSLFVYSQNNGNGQTHWKVSGNQADLDKFIGTTNSMPLIFKVNNLEQLRLTELGNLGLGVTNPANKLEVNGNVKFYNSLMLPNIQELPTNSTPQYFLVLDQNGNILKRAFNLPEIPIDNGPVSICDLAMPDGSTILSNPYWKSGPNKLYPVCPDVFVGISTTAPRVHLDVNGTTYSSKLALGNVDPSAITNYFHLKAPLTDNDGSSNLFLVENSSRKLMQLNNQGLLQVREVKVDLTNWPDYVFEKNYSLMPLQNVQSYIQSEGHLPNVPSAQQVSENGVSLGEMNKILLQKIEELTLYIINQETRIQELEKTTK